MENTTTAELLLHANQVEGTEITMEMVVAADINPEEAYLVQWRGTLRMGHSTDRCGNTRMD